MSAITDADWGRIYAFIWKKFKEGDPSYKEEFERNPAAVIQRINVDLQKENHPGISYSTLLDIGDRPKDLTEDQLDDIIAGRKIAFLQTRLTC
ncbi:MAG: hypothetical protein AB7P69_28765 [Candidatus Binatia bacterium]